MKRSRPRIGRSDEAPPLGCRVTALHGGEVTGGDALPVKANVVRSGTFPPERAPITRAFMPIAGWPHAGLDARQPSNGQMPRRATACMHGHRAPAAA